MLPPVLLSGKELPRMWPDSQPRVVERLSGCAGELQLQKRGEHYEIIYNGVFLMATYNGITERAAVEKALQKLVSRHGAGLRVLMGGLGVGYSLQEALRWPQVDRVVVAEIEKNVIAWNYRYLRSFNGDAVMDPRVVLLHQDFLDTLQEQEQEKDKDKDKVKVKIKVKVKETPYHLVVVDTDNGSTWLSRAENEQIYSCRGLELLQRCLLPGGMACFWTSRREPEFERRLHPYFRAPLYETRLEETGLEAGFYLAEKA